MDKNLIKNTLDLEYNNESQKANTFLILLTADILGFLGSYMWLKNSSFVLGIVITIIASTAGAIFYYKSSKRMKQIIFEIKNLQ